MNFYDTLQTALDEYGLKVRGSFVTQSTDHLPALDGCTGQTSLTLVGNIGSSLWASFSRSEEYNDGKKHPLDRWSKRIGLQLGHDLGGLALFPLDGPPYWPFLSWARKAEGLTASPLGLNFHPQYGLWHAYRFALLLPVYSDHLRNERIRFDEEFDCSSCIEQPCLQSCPVGAFNGQSYDDISCVQHLDKSPQAYCNSHGCLARHACPVGQAYAYTAQQASFHMQAFKLGA